MNKNLIIMGMVAGACSAFAMNAQAEESNSNIYVGFELSKISVDYKTVNGIDYSEIYEDSFTGYNPYIGFDINSKLAIEVGYLNSSTERKNYGAIVIPGLGTVTGNDTEFKGFHIDAVGKYAISDKVDLLGSAGLARLETESTFIISGGNISITDKDTALRLGIGTEYAVYNNVNIRAMVHYTDIDIDGITDNLIQYGVGASYHF